MDPLDRSGTRLIIAADWRGNVVAAALSRDDDEVRSGLEPLPGQFLHEIEAPDEVVAMEAPGMLASALEGARVSPSGRLLFRKIQLEE